MKVCPCSGNKGWSISCRTPSPAAWRWHQPACCDVEGPLCPDDQACGTPSSLPRLFLEGNRNALSRRKV